MSTAHTNRRKRSALRVARHFGTGATLIKVGESFNRDTMVNTPTTTSYAVSAAVIRPKMVRAEDGSMVESGDLQVVLPALAFDSGVTPETADRVTVGGVTYRIDKVSGVGPGGTFVEYVLDVGQVVAD